MARAWEQVFSNYLPKRLDALAEDLIRELQSFHMRMRKREQLKKSSSFDLVSQKANTYEMTLKDTKGFMLLIKAGHREANRQLTPAVAEAMECAYRTCGTEKGQSSPPTGPSSQHAKNNYFTRNWEL
jgi:hypothetical protein